MKRTISMLMIFVLILSLQACGATPSAPDPNAGVYEAESAEMLGYRVSVEDVFENGFSIELLNGGKAKFNYEGKTYSLKWTLDGTAFHAQGGGAKLDGSLSEGVMILENVLDSGIQITLVNHSYQSPAAQAAQVETPATAPEVGAPASKAEPEEVQAASVPRSASADSWWSGRWYGWFLFYSADGAYADYEDSAFDVVADIAAKNGLCDFLLWPYNGSQDDPFAKGMAFFENGATDAGRMVSISGTCLSAPLGPGAWSVDPGLGDARIFDHMIEISGTYTDSDSPSDSYSYRIFLRPWGDTWEDVAETTEATLPVSDMLPPHYNDWYIPQLSGQAPLEQELPAQDLVGEWTYSNRYTYVFRQDGTGSYLVSSRDLTFTYEVSGSSLSILYTGNTSPYLTTYTIQDNKLILKDSFGNDVVYVKK